MKKRTNIGMDEWKSENYIPVSINLGYNNYHYYHSYPDKSIISGIKLEFLRRASNTTASRNFLVEQPILTTNKRTNETRNLINQMAMQY